MNLMQLLDELADLELDGEPEDVQVEVEMVPRRSISGIRADGDTVLIYLEA